MLIWNSVCGNNLKTRSVTCFRKIDPFLNNEQLHPAICPGCTMDGIMDRTAAWVCGNTSSTGQNQLSHKAMLVEHSQHLPAQEQSRLVDLYREVRRCFLVWRVTVRETLNIIHHERTKALAWWGVTSSGSLMMRRWRKLEAILRVLGAAEMNLLSASESHWHIFIL